MTSWIVVAAVVFGMPPAVPPLTGCEARRLGEDGWQYVCASGLMAIAVEASGPDALAKKVFQERVDHLAVEAGIAERKRERRMLGGDSVDVILLGTGAQTQIFALLTAGERYRIVFCRTAGEPRRCDEVLETLVTRPWGTHDPVPESKKVAPMSMPVLPGFTLLIPDGCTGRFTTDGGGNILCRASVARWSFTPDQGKAHDALDAKRKEFADAVAGDSGGNLRVVEDDVPCRLAGKETVCRLQVMRRRDFVAGAEETSKGVTIHDPLTSISAYVRLEGQLLVAYCKSLGSSGMGVPCAALFELR